MAQITLSRLGSELGQRILPGSFRILGQRFSGAQLGRRLGRLAGRAVDDILFGETREGPRLTELHVMESREGVGIPNVYGRMRVAGQLIWAGDFRENRQTQRQGKGGPETATYTYTVSFAVAVGEGPNAQLGRVWANGEMLSLGKYTHRFYSGSETQIPDPVIEAHEGLGKAPAYLGLSYIVFEDFPLEVFGNRLPQLSFEVIKSPISLGAPQAAEVIKSVNIIPATGEFVYASEPVSVRTFPGRESPLNVTADAARADFEVSLDQLEQGLPHVSEVSLTVGWFGDDLRAEHCEIRPGIETKDRVTVPFEWSVGGTGRSDSHLVSQTPEGNAYYGGTPADEAVRQGLQSLKSRGHKVTLTPFLLMDVPPGSVLPDPSGSGSQPPFPWRGRIRSELNGTSSVHGAVAGFLGQAQPGDFSVSASAVNYHGPPDDWGYRRFILHHAHLAVLAGGVDGFLIGSEMRGATQLHDGQGAFPFVEGLCQLADEVKAILGPSCEVSYAADWSEYAAFVPGDGTNDVWFPLDRLWARPSIDYVGIDWYPPAGDWRDGETHLDWQAGYRSPGETAYLLANQSGGEGFDWYYASQADRDAQLRSPIVDTAHGEDWVFRVKDLQAWWSSAHYERPGGVRAASPTDWQAGSKPVRFSEIGFPAVDKGTNSPNLFFDPKSSESAVPPYSNGARDDVLQAAALTGVLEYWQDKPFISGASVWAWDARPFPDFPARIEVWSDGDNWMKGHWLNGRTGFSNLSSVLDDLCGRAGVPIENAAIAGVLSGYAILGETRLTDAVAPLVAAFGLDCIEDEERLGFTMGPTDTTVILQAEDLVDEPVKVSRQTSSLPPHRLTLLYASLDDTYEPATADVRAEGAEKGTHLAARLPLALSAPQAEIIAKRLLAEARMRDQVELALPRETGLALANRVLAFSGSQGDFRATSLEIGAHVDLQLEPARPLPTPANSIDVPGVGAAPSVTSTPDIMIIDGPGLQNQKNHGAMIVAAYAEPWPSQVSVSAGPAGDVSTPRISLSQPALTGVLLEDLPEGPAFRWDRGGAPLVEMAFAGLSSVGEEGVLAGQNRILVETPGGWELIAFAWADLVAANTYRLSGLLRSLQSSRSSPYPPAAAGSRCVFVDDALGYAAMAPDEVGFTQLWSGDPGGFSQTIMYQGEAQKPWAPIVLDWAPASRHLTWAERGLNVSNDLDAPDPAQSGVFDLSWLSSGDIAEQVRIAAQSYTLPQDAHQIRLRSVAPSGVTGDWVTIADASPT